MKYLLLLLIFLTGCTTATNLGGDLELSDTSIQDKFDASIIIKEDYILEGTKFIKEAKDENSIRIEIGNDTDEFSPDFKISRWDDEVWFKMKPRDIEAGSLKLEGGKIKHKGTKKEYHFYEDGESYEAEVILLEKPDTNIITFDIETKGLDFFYQPELTQEEIDEGASRPENVIGSYAVYHSTKKDHIIGQKNYGTGKFGMIYKPQMCDSNEWCVWGELNIDTKQNIQTVTMPINFWNNAVYPVRHATGETFGYESAGASITSIAYAEAPGYYEFYRRGNEHTILESGTAINIKAYLSADEIYDAKVFINEKDSISSNSHGLVATTENVDISITEETKTFVLSGESLIASTTYVLNLMGDADSLEGVGVSIYLHYDTHGEYTIPRYTEDWYDSAGTTEYASPENPWTETPSDYNRKYSMWVTYTPTPELIKQQEMINYQE